MEANTYNYDTFRSTCAQVLASLAFECLMLNVAIIIGTPVIVIGALRQPDSPLHFTQDQASWFAGLIFIVQPLGSVLSGPPQDFLGRKLCMLLVNIPEFIAWLVMYYASTPSTLFYAVAAMGLSLGFMEAPVLSYIGEISEPRLRGILSTLGGIFFNVGLMISAFIGAATDWRTMMLICSAFPVVAFVALLMVPDSPAWLVTKGRVEDARKAYQWLRGWVPPEAVQEELDALIIHFKQNRNPRVVNSSEYRSVTTKKVGPNNSSVPESKVKLFLHPSVQRPLRLIALYFFIAACASLMAMRPFFIEVLGSLNLPIRPHLVIVYGSSLVLLGSLIATLTMRRVGKRGLTFWSLGLSVACCFGLALYLYLGLLLPWIPLLIFSVSFFAAPLGIIPVPWILISEVFPLKARGIATGVAAAMGYLIMFLIIMTYYPLVSLVTVAGACFLYGLVGLLGLVYLYFRLPETEGMAMEDIEAVFKREKTIKMQTNKYPADSEENKIRLKEMNDVESI